MRQRPDADADARPGGRRRAVNETLRDGILKFALNGGNVVAPPCTQQPRFNLGGALTQFPQVKAASGVQGRRSRRARAVGPVACSALMGRLPRILGAAMGTAARRPLAVGLLVTVLALAGAALALRLLADDRDPRRWSGSSSAVLPGDRARPPAASARTRSTCSCAAPVSKLVLTSDLERLIGLEGCLGGNVPKGATPVGGWDGPCGRLGKSQAGRRSSSAPARSSTSRSRQIGDQFNEQLSGDQGRRPEAVQRGLQARARQGLLEGARPRRWPRRPSSSRQTQSLQRRDQARAQVRDR